MDASVTEKFRFRDLSAPPMALKKLIMARIPSSQLVPRKGSVIQGNDAHLELINDFLAVGRHNNRCSGFIDLFEDIHDLPARIRVQISGRFIGDEDMRHIDQRTGDGNSRCSPDSSLGKAFPGPPDQPVSSLQAPGV